MNYPFKALGLSQVSFVVELGWETLSIFVESNFTIGWLTKLNPNYIYINLYEILTARNLYSQFSIFFLMK